MKISCHQINFLPWFNFFYKMHKSDVFVLMINCQFEKNGYQNRAKVFDEWWTLPVVSGNVEIKDKFYTNGNKLTDVNIPLIIGFAKMLGINTSKIHYDFPTEKRGTDRIIEICKRFDCDEYLTNPEATGKYLDEKALNDSGIEIVACDSPYKKHLFEMFDEFGVEGTVKLLEKEWPCKV